MFPRVFLPSEAIGNIPQVWGAVPDPVPGAPLSNSF